jgi:hypothetical protein
MRWVFLLLFFGNHFSIFLMLGLMLEVLGERRHLKGSILHWSPVQFSVTRLCSSSVVGLTLQLTALVFWYKMLSRETTVIQLLSRDFLCHRAEPQGSAEHSLGNKGNAAELFVFRRVLTKFMERSSSWKTDSRSAGQEISHLLRNPKVHYRVHHILSQTNPVHILTPYYPYIYD